MNRELIERREFISSIRSLAEEIGQKGDSYSASQLFHIADFSEQMVIQINALEIQERIDRDFMRKNLEEFDKMRRAFIDFIALVRERHMENDPDIKSIINKSGIVI
jgi:hypothetical protein